MANIYEIVDCNGLRYVGSTERTLPQRLSVHKADKKRSKKCSSRKLDLDNCDINLLEVCDDSVKKERERHYINTLECVNIHKLNGSDHKAYNKKYYEYTKSWGYPHNYKDNNLLRIDVNLFQ